MAVTSEEKYMDWLDREEERLGFTAIEDAMGDIEDARALFYEELGYDMTEGQFLALKGTLQTRYEEFPAISITFERIEQKWGYQPAYRDITTGRFVSREDVYSLLTTIRGL